MDKMNLYLRFGTLTTLCILVCSCSHADKAVTQSKTEPPIPILGDTDMPAEIVSLLEFDECDSASTWHVGDKVVYQLQLFNGNTTTSIVYFTLTVNSTTATGDDYSAYMTITKDSSETTIKYSSPMLPGRVQIFQKGKQSSSSDTLLPKRFLEKGIMASCDSNDITDTGKGFLALLSFMQMIQKDPALRPILYKVITPPPIWTIIFRGPNINIHPNFDEKSKCQEVFGAFSCEGYKFPIDLDINNTPALRVHMTVIKPVSPFHTSGGIVSIEGSDLRKPETHFILKLISATRGKTHQYRETQPIAAGNREQAPGSCAYR